ncbi:MAG: hypothetical protein UH850_11405 [Paludibacteraceae bacterium]|nr:hypothetical protein [Paludibacteraceae bacterium]
MEETKMSAVVDEIKNADAENLKKVIEDWLERTRTDGMKLGAYFVSAAVAGAIEKNLKDGMNSSHRDFERAIKRVLEIVSVQLKQEETQQNDSEKVAEVANDGTTE